MAIIPLCARLANGQDSSCLPPQRRYFQQAVIGNLIDIQSKTISKTDFLTPPYTCKYTVEFEMKPGTKGFRFTGPQNGNGYFGRTNKSTSDNGFVQYQHEVQMLVTGVSEEAKCVLESLDKANVFVAIQFTDGTVEIYGIENGLSTGDYTISVSENGGGVLVILQSNENSPENYLPLVYKSATQDGETEDFDSEFENPASS